MGVAPMDGVGSATVGDCSGDCVGTSSSRALTMMGGNRGVETKRSMGSGAGSGSGGFALGTWTEDGDAN